MGNKGREAGKGTPDGKKGRPSLGDAYPTIARWASGYGWVEFGIDGLDRPFVRALDEGGTLWESEARFGSLDEALEDLEAGLVRFMEEQGFLSKSTHKDTTRPSRKAARKVKTVARKPLKPPAEPALKKVEKLLEIAEALRKGEDFSITRLTVLKKLCEDRRAAGEFGLFLARKARKRLKEGESSER